MPLVNLDDKEEVKEYENFIEHSPHGHMMQSMHWARVKSNWDADYVYVRDETGKIAAAVSLLSIKNDGEHSFMYAPRGPVCDLYDIDLVDSLIEEIHQSGVLHNRNVFLLRMDPEVLYDEALVEHYRKRYADNFNFRSRELKNEKAFSNPRHHMILEFNGRSVDDIIATYHKKFRYSIRRTYKDGLTTLRLKTEDPNFDQAIDTFYELTQQMAGRKEISHRPKDYFVRVMNAFNNAVLYETRDDEEVLASGIVVSYNRKAFYMYAATSDNKRRLQPSVQMVVEAMRDAVEAGMEEFDFGGVYHFDSSDGLYLFKSKYTGHEGLKEYMGELDFIFDQSLYADMIK